MRDLECLGSATFVVFTLLLGGLSTPGAARQDRQLTMPDSIPDSASADTMQVAFDSLRGDLDRLTVRLGAVESRQTNPTANRRGVDQPGASPLVVWTVAGLAVVLFLGLAGQPLWKNIIGGLVMAFRKPFAEGDRVAVGTTSGDVISVAWWSISLRTADDQVVTLPNRKILEEGVVNFSHGARQIPVVVHLYLPGSVEVMQAKDVARSAMANSQYAYLDKPIVVDVTDEFRGTFVTHLVVRGYVVDKRHRDAFASDVTEAAKTEYLKRGMVQPQWNSATPPETPSPTHEGS